MIDHGMDVQEAIDAPRIHEQWLPDTISLEPFALSQDTRWLLEQRGYTFEDEGQWGIAEDIVMGTPRPGAQNGKTSAFLSLGAPLLKGATMFGAHDPRGGAGLAVPVK